MVGPQAFEARLLSFCRQHRLFPTGEGVVVGVSGGPDSLSLLYALARRRELGVCLHAAHLNHGLRGEEGEEEAHFVARTCQELDVPCTLGEEDVAAFRRQARLSLEEAARRVRYRFLAQVAHQAGATAVAVGHTAADQVEAVLLHLVRGSGLRGLGGMAPLSPFPAKGVTLRLARPLLWASREDTEGYCQALRLSPRHDPSNLSLSYRRNFLRHQVLPLLRQLNPNLDQAILRLASSLREDLSFVEGEVDRVWGEVVGEGGGIALDPYLRLPPALRRRLLLQACQAAWGSLADISAAHVLALEELAKGGGVGWVSLPGGRLATREGGRLWLGDPPPCPFPPLSGEHPLTVPGETLLPGWRLRAEIESPPAPAQAAGDFSARMDWERVGGPLLLRPRRPGDRFQPLGMSVEKKLQDFMVDAKLPRPWRDSIPLLCSGERILWVVGYRIDERVKVTAATRQVLSIELDRR